MTMRPNEVRGSLGMKGLLGVVHYALFPAAGTGDWDPAESLDILVGDDAFGAIEITWIKDGETRKRVAKTLRESGMQVMFSGGPPLLGSGLSLCDLDEAGRWQAVGFAKSLVDMAYELGSRNLLIASGPDPGEALRSSAIQAFERSLEEICLHASGQQPDHPLVICVEPFDRDVHWRQLVGSTRLAAQVIREVRGKCQNCGITLDMSHVAQLGEDLATAIDEASDCLVHAHIANCVLDPQSPLYGDMHPPFGVNRGEYGPGDVGRYVELLKRSGYFSRPCLYGKPVVSFEVRPTEGLDPEAVLEECKRSVFS